MATREALAWLEYADHDLATAMTMMSSRPMPLEIVCFHLQQYAEKYLKACLAESRIAFPKTHDLLTLSRLLKGIYPIIEAIETDCDSLSDFATITRYPHTGMILVDSDAADALVRAGRIVECCRIILGKIEE